jgi:hypothetical protein
VRRVTAILTSVVLLLTFVEAPSLHTHQHEVTQRHPGRLLHLHLHLRSNHPAGGGPEFRGLDPDDDAQLQSWFSATAADSGLFPVILADGFCLPIPERSGLPVEAPLPAGHDPPLLCSRSPRAPPA